MNILNFINSDYSNWTYVVQFGIVSLMLLIANIIRRNFKIFKNLLIPTAIIAGFIGLGVKYLLFYFNTLGLPPVLENTFLQSITYHTIAIGFVAMGLKSVKKEGSNEIKGRPFKTGLIIVNTYLLQGIIALFLSIILSYIFQSVASFSGLLFPMGFGQGPGQAGNIGGIFEESGFIGGKSFGFAVATLGTIWASVAGIFYINKRAKEGSVARVNKEEGTSVTSDLVESKEEIPLSEAIDKMSIQIIFVAIVYFASYLIMLGLTSLIKIETATSLIWGFNFIFGMLVAILVRFVLAKLKEKDIIKRKYTNEYMLNRITGVVFDYLIVASIMAIDVSIFKDIGLWIALLGIGTVVGFVTYFYLRRTIYKVYTDYPHEAFSVLFGNLTGTASNGIALLREIDPNFDTPAADDLVTGSSTAVLFGAPILVIIGIITNPAWYIVWISLIVMILFFLLFSYFIHKEKREVEE